MGFRIQGMMQFSVSTVLSAYGIKLQKNYSS